MRRIFFYLTALVGLGAVVASCSDDKENPGDFNLKSTLSLSSVTSKGGFEAPLTVKSERDTTYRYFAVKNDTTFDANGEPLIGPDGKVVYVEDTIYYNSKITARFIEYDTVFLPAAADTFHVDVVSNARWYANVPAVPEIGGKPQTQFYFNYNSTTTGGGDSYFEFRTIRNRTRMRKYPALQYVHTQDSTVMFLIPFKQHGEKD